jgi:hypothetical protein
MLCNLLMHNCIASGLKFNFVPMVGFADLSFCPRMSDLMSLKVYEPDVIFMLDCPAFAVPSMLLTMHTQVMSNFEEELRANGTLDYMMYTYSFDQELVRFLSNW